MNSDTRIVLQIVLAFAVYGIANRIGNVGYFVPPIIIDPIVIVGCGILLAVRSRLQPLLYQLPLLILVAGTVGMALLNHGVIAFLEHSTNAEFQAVSVEQATVIATLSSGALILSLVLYIIALYRTKFLLGNKSKVFALLFLIIQLLGILFGILNWPGDALLIAQLLVTGIWVIYQDNQQERPAALLRYSLIIWLVEWLDVLQLIAFNQFGR
jgi:hypothetical protein